MNERNSGHSPSEVNAVPAGAVRAPGDAVLLSELLAINNILLALSPGASPYRRGARWRTKKFYSQDGRGQEGCK